MYHAHRASDAPRSWDKGGQKAHVSHLADFVIESRYYTYVSARFQSDAYSVF